MNLIPFMHETAGDAPDTLRQYAREISQHAILSRDEEREIAERIRTHNDKKAEEKLVTANLRFVIKIARQYCRWEPNLLDLIQEGNLGLVRAVRKYDPKRGTRFSTYAAFWVRAYILKHLMDSRSIVKMGTNDAERRLFYSLKREKGKLEKAGVGASSDELAHAFGVTASDVEDMELRLRNIDVSLDEPCYGEGDTLMDMMSNGEDVEETIADRQERDLVEEWLGDFRERLNDKQRFILDHRIMAEEPTTLEEIGERFHVSRESVRQMQVKISKTLVQALRSKASTSGRLTVSQTTSNSRRCFS